jgi:hypothetical protein
MFIPRSLSKRAPKPATISSESPRSVPAPADSTARLPGPYNPNKRNIHADEQSESESSDDTSNGSDDGPDESETSGSDSDSASESNGEHERSTSTLTLEPKAAKAFHTVTRQQQAQSEIAARIELALSDLSLWRNESLYHRLTEAQDWCKSSPHPLLLLLTCGNRPSFFASPRPSSPRTFPR